MTRPTLSISIDTEEDNWGAYVRDGATVDNIAHLRELQDLFDRYEARPTYLVNYAPLVNSDSVAVLGELSEREAVEIGGHCHPWNTPPDTGEGAHRSMMNGLTLEENRGKIRTVCSRMEAELGVRPKSFRAGRWGLGPTVAQALVDEAFEVDCSVTPFIDWSSIGGPDYSEALEGPYTFSAACPLQPDPGGELVELPTTIGYLRGRHRMSNRIRRALGHAWMARLRVVGVADRMGLLTRRWLSPEGASGQEMARLVDAYLKTGATFLQLTFHSCDLLPGATPFVHDQDDRARFLGAIDEVLAHCRSSGLTFATLREHGRAIRAAG